MSAPNLETVFNYEEAFEAAAAAVVATAGVAADTARSTRTVAKTRVAVEFEYGGAESPTIQTQPDRYQQHTGTLRVHVITERDQNPRNEIEVPLTETIRTLHASYVSRVRAALTRSALDSQLAYYQLVRLRPAGTTRSYEVERYDDRTVEEYDVLFGIRADAWPAEPTSEPAS